ncbi:helix-turn-helix transcriptional regulator [Lysobacter sp. Root604]|uniref:helix-turn-helix domain-containing protein n=1 Tax=Lysobacter sp. Root604 TaxID=1736568 RepID=UPI0009E8B2ED|nr:helix-turn-helix transcriptional regulator [Lysobacter sp. Root604]
MAKSLYRPENLELAAVLRELREGLGLTQTQFATRLGRGQTYVSNVELGIKRLDLVEVRDYCAALEVPLATLVAQWESRLGPAPSPKSARRAQKTR